MRAGILNREDDESDKAACLSRNSRMVLILAGGKGRRMRPLIKSWLGEDRPKQYCTYCGSRSMLQHTVDRAIAVAPPACIYTVIGQGQHVYLDQAVPAGLPGQIIEQPLDRGTASSIFLVTAHILVDAPQSTMLVLPSDAFVYPEELFCWYADRACRLAECPEDRLILLGAIPDRPETDYGWIELAPDEEPLAVNERNGRPVPIVGIYEKPDRKMAKNLLGCSSLWNTMIFAVKARTLWNLGWECTPDMMRQFEGIRQALHAFRQKRMRKDQMAAVISSIYQEITSACFSRDILSHAANRCQALLMRKLYWSDWGRPERVKETLDCFGISPAFSSEFLHDECREDITPQLNKVAGVGMDSTKANRRFVS